MRVVEAWKLASDCLPPKGRNPNTIPIPFFPETTPTQCAPEQHHGQNTMSHRSLAYHIITTPQRNKAQKLTHKTTPYPIHHIPRNPQTQHALSSSHRIYPHTETHTYPHLQHKYTTTCASRLPPTKSPQHATRTLPHHKSPLAHSHK